MLRPADSWAPARDNAWARTARSLALPRGLAHPMGGSSLGFVHQPAPKARFAQLCDQPKKCPNQLEQKSLLSDRLHPAHRTRELGREAGVSQGHGGGS